MEKTLAIIKPDATDRNIVGKIIASIEDAGFRNIALKRIHMSKDQAEDFYSIHKSRPFFADLVDSMIKSPVVILVLEKENAVSDYRDLMGATDPKQAADGTIRKKFGISIGENSVHGSDSIENSIREINFFFDNKEIVG